MEKIEWLVFTCRACRRVIKLPPAMAGGSVVCPFCRTKVTVPKDAVVIEEAATHNPIPQSREQETSTSFRGRGREEWEVGNRPIGGDLSFKDRLASTAQPELQPDAPGSEMRRANFKRRKLQEVQGDFDEPDETRRRRRHRRSHNKGTEFAHTFVRGLVIAVILMAGVAAWMGWKLYQQKQKPVQLPTYTQVKPPAPADGPDGPPLETRIMADYGPALKDTIQRFTSAKSVDDILPLIRDRERLEPKIRAFYSATNPWRPLEIRNKLDKDETFAVDGNFIVLTLTLANFDTAPISLERKGESFLVDWESFTGYGELTWSELKEKRPREPVLMRVVIDRSISTDYYNGPFSDAEAWRCYQIHDLGSQHLLSAYAAKGSPVDVKIRQHLKPMPAPANGLDRTLAVIRVRYPEESKGPHQVEITEFLEDGWVFRPDN